MKSTKNIECPSCKEHDRIQFLQLTSEQEDGTEYIGEAAKCTRCDLVAPIAAWKRMRKAPARKKRDTPEVLERSNRLVDAMFERNRICNSESSSFTTHAEKDIVLRNGQQYWTLHQERGISPLLATQIGTLPSRKAFPHQGFCSFGFDTPEELANHIIFMGSDPSEIFRRGARLARVNVQNNRLSIEFFSSWQAASEAQSIFLAAELGAHHRLGKNSRNSDIR